MSKDKDSNNIQQESQKETDKVNLDKDDLEYIEEENKKKKKVELDLDDAPFLQEEEPKEKQEEPATSPSQEKESEEEPTPPPKKKKWLLIGIIALFLILIGGGYFLFFNKTAPPPPTPVEQKPKETKQTPPPPEEKVIPLKQFLVELKNKKKQPLFLEIKLSFATTNNRLEWEIKRKKIVLRDAIYYYLTNKEYNFLANTKNIPKLKQDILNVVNQYLNNGQLKKILIEHYVIS
ncbi:flagellar FliL protein [Desulfonauticus submarinus]|uniref:Flagellar protein FliL n=1 Tax=Desulfonauticus submarinus TaxID=206665 RepID=A0A1H0B698_9BACT|nr:flagellar basal body-associated FliL family protein [Desulfonauticus submarinus]SDN41187.1 flagellar FliL protein [Desulfonauticus submarinus]